MAQTQCAKGRVELVYKSTVLTVNVLKKADLVSVVDGLAESRSNPIPPLFSLYSCFVSPCYHGNERSRSLPNEFCVTITILLALIQF